jgi:transcriptional regulator GlxA family with amidase domain
MSETTIAIGIWDGVEELDFVGPYEVLTAWSGYTSGNGGVRVLTVAETADVIRCAHGLQVVPDATWDRVGDVDVVLLPGGNTRGLVGDERMLARVRDYAGRGTLMTSVCTGALVYAAAGLLAGRQATTHWSAIESLRSYDDVEVKPDARFVDTGEVITAAGVSAGIDMALHLVARLDSVDRARDVRRYIQYDPEPPV